MTKLTTRRSAVTFKENLTPDSTDKSSIMFDYYFLAALTASLAVKNVVTNSMLSTRDSWSTFFYSSRFISDWLTAITFAYKWSWKILARA